MSKSIPRRIKIFLIAFLTLAFFIIVGNVAFAKSENTIEGLYDVKTLQMEDARLIVKGDDGVNGLQFVASISEAEYEGIMSLIGEGKAFRSISTNLIIMPEYYVEEKGVPGDMDFWDTYDWAEYVDGEWVYTESDKIRVININANDWVKKGNKYLYTGAIVDILEQNESIDFRAFAYIEALTIDYSYSVVLTFSDKQATDDGAYIVTSIDKELKEEFSSMSASQKAWVRENWMTIDSYTDDIEYLVDVKDKITYDITNAIYDEDAKVLIEMLGKENLTYKLTDVNGKVKTERVLDVTKDDSLRLWSIEISYGDKVIYTGKADIYDSSESAVWNDMTANSGIENGLLIRDEDTKINGVMQSVKYTGSYTTEDGKPVIKATTSSRGFYVTVLPIHSKAYYEKYQDGDYTFTYNWKYTSQVAWNSGSQAFYFLNGTNWDGSNKPDTWYSNNLTLKQIVNNWDNFTKFETRVWGERYKVSMFCTYNILLGSGNTDIYINLSLVDNQAVNTLVDLDKVEDKTSVSLGSIINKGVYSNLVNNYPSADWYLVDFDGNEMLIENKDDFDISGLEKVEYTLKVKDGSVVVFSASFDVYDSKDPLVWNTVSNQTKKYVKVYQFIDANRGDGLLENAVSITEDGFFKATSNEFYYYSYTENGKNVIVSPIEYMSVKILPLHSKSYYQRFYGEGLVV